MNDHVAEFRLALCKLDRFDLIDLESRLTFLAVALMGAQAASAEIPDANLRKAITTATLSAVVDRNVVRQRISNIDRHRPEHQRGRITARDLQQPPRRLP